MHQLEDVEEGHVHFPAKQFVLWEASNQVWKRNLIKDGGTYIFDIEYLKGIIPKGHM